MLNMPAGSELPPDNNTCGPKYTSRWVIVSDGSTDDTEDIVERHIGEYPWMELLRIPDRAERHFAAKVRAFNAGYATLRGLSYDIIGNLDADISFDNEYFMFLLSKFAENPRLGVAGTPFREGPHQYDYRFTNIAHVSGACQMFRRTCFEAIGGYKPIKVGGIDWVAVTSARMAGWQTRTFTEKVCVHNRPMGTAQNSGLAARFRQGIKDYCLGGHPLWEVFRAAYQMNTRPYVLGGAFLLSGYLWGLLCGAQLAVPQKLVAFHRMEQMDRLKAMFLRLLGLHS
jgi:hypothetical protein